MTEADPFVNIDIMRIGSAVGNRIGGSGNIDFGKLPNKFEGEDARNTAHVVKIGLQSVLIRAIRGDSGGLATDYTDLHGLEDFAWVENPFGIEDLFDSPHELEI